MVETSPLVVLTRPEGENEALAERLRIEGLKCLLRPMIKLSGLGEAGGLKQTAMDLDHFDLVIFVSKSAVQFGMPHFDRYWPSWPLRLQWYSVGEGTAAALDVFDVRADFPQVAGSEGLLALPGLKDVAGKKVLIVRGRGGRELLADTLRERGADVQYFEAYERTPLTYAEWRFPDAGVIAVLTSGEILEHFLAQIGAAKQQVRFIVPSSRIAERARHHGLTNPIIAAGASEQALYDAVLNECRMLDG